MQADKMDECTNALLNTIEKYHAASEQKKNTHLLLVYFPKCNVLVAFCVGTDRVLFIVVQNLFIEKNYIKAVIIPCVDR